METPRSSDVHLFSAHSGRGLSGRRAVECTTPCRAGRPNPQWRVGDALGGNSRAHDNERSWLSTGTNGSMSPQRRRDCLVIGPISSGTSIPFEAPNCDESTVHQEPVFIATSVASSMSQSGVPCANDLTSPPCGRHSSTEIGTDLGTSEPIPFEEDRFGFARKTLRAGGGSKYTRRAIRPTCRTPFAQFSASHRCPPFDVFEGQVFRESSPSSPR